MAHYVRCPQCSEEGYQYLEDKRRRFRCNACGLDTYLKLLNLNKEPPFNPLEIILETIDEMCQMGLNSENPKHWEAALQDILTFIRKQYDKTRTETAQRSTR